MKSVLYLSLNELCSIFEQNLKGRAVCSISASRRYYAMFLAAPHRL